MEEWSQGGYFDKNIYQIFVQSIDNGFVPKIS